MKAFLKIIVVAMALLGAIQSHAQQVEPFVQVRPMNTALYLPSEGGNGWLFDIFPSGLVFGAHYTYGPDNQTSWLILQGNYVANNEADRLRTGILGRASSQLFEGRNGSCFGCPYVAPSIVPSVYGSGEIVWFDPRRAEFRWNGQVKQLTRLGDLEAASSGSALFKGRWRVARIVQSGGTASEQDQGFVTFRDRTSSRVYFRDGRPTWDPKIPVPQDTWPQYEVVCFPPVGGISCSPSFAGTPDGQGRTTNPVYYSDPSTGDIHGINYCDSTQFPDCAVADTVNGQPIIRVTFRARFDVLIQSREVMFIRSSSSLGAPDDLRFSQEWVLRRALDGVQ